MIEIVENNYKNKRYKYLLRCPYCGSLLKVGQDDLYLRGKAYSEFAGEYIIDRDVFKFWYTCPACDCAVDILSSDLEEKRIEEE